MPTQVTTSTDVPIRSFNGRGLDRNQDGTLWAVVQQDVFAVASTRYSKDNGATWQNAGNIMPGGSTSMYARHSSLFIDQDDYAHLAWKQSAAGGGNLTNQYLFYSRGTPNAGRTAWTWSTAVTINDDTNGDYPDVVAHREGTGWAAHTVFSFLNGTINTVYYRKVVVSSGGALTRDAGSTLLGPSAGYGVGVHTYPSIDFNHTGDGKTVAGGTPHLYVGWTAGATGAGKGVRFRKAVYSAGSWTWNPEREVDTLKTTDGVSAWLTTHFDGVRAVLSGYLFGDGGSIVVLYERDAADTTPTTRVLLGNPGSQSIADADRLGYGSTSYDSAGNVYLFGRDSTGASGTRKLNWRKWTRQGATLGPINTFEATGSDAPYISAKRGSQPGNSIEVVYTDGTASPYSVMYDRTVPDVNAPATPYVPAILL